MGAKTFNAPLLLDFLRKNESDVLYLVGDIIDGWKLTKRWFWPDIYNAVLEEIFRKKQQGTKIIYVTGNHDEALRYLRLHPQRRFWKNESFVMTNEMIHHAADGKKYIVTHGDQFDRKILQGDLSKISDRFYAWISDRLHREGPYIQIKGKKKRFSLAKAVNTTGNWALNLLSNFENMACRHAKNLHMDGIICGHTHVPSFKTVNKIIYANSGGWLRNLHTALVETHGGALDLIEWHSSDEIDFSYDPAISDRTHNLVSMIAEIWPVKPKIVPKSQPDNLLRHSRLKSGMIRSYKRILAS